MSYQNDLTQNNTDLQAILATVNALPEAGSGGTSVETCSVELNTLQDSVGFNQYSCTVLSDGIVTTQFDSAMEYAKTITINNVICNSFIVVRTAGSGAYITYSAVGLETIFPIPYGIVIKVTSEPNSVASAYIVNNL